MRTVLHRPQAGSYVKGELLQAAYGGCLSTEKPVCSREADREGYRDRERRWAPSDPDEGALPLS